MISSCTKPEKGNLLRLVQDILINIISTVELELVTNENTKKGKKERTEKSEQKYT
jgi:hypothetical protein